MAQNWGSFVMRQQPQHLRSVILDAVCAA